MNKVLVTGGAGFIGSHVCKELFRAGYDPVSIDNLSTGQRHNVKWGDLHVVDLRDRDDLLRTFESSEFIGVVHLAASAYVGESQTFPLKYFENNLVSTINVLILMEELGIKNLVFSSSCATYGKGDGLPFKEDSPQVPINNYGLSKKMCEEIILNSNASSKRNSSLLRYFNASGADSDGDIIEEHMPETHVIPLLIDSAINGNVFEIYGNDYETRDGSAIRDYVHVTDLAKAHVLALNGLIEAPGNYVFNLGSGVGVSVFELVKVMENFGLRPRIRIGNRRLGDPEMLVADVTLAYKKLGWQPLNSKIENIIRTTVSSKTKKYQGTSI